MSEPEKNPFRVGDVVDWKDPPFECDTIDADWRAEFGSEIEAIEEFRALYGDGPYTVCEVYDAKVCGTIRMPPPYVRIAPTKTPSQDAPKPELAASWFKLVRRIS